jgi:hypothetical protein
LPENPLCGFSGGTGDWGTGNGGAVRKRREKPEREAWKEGNEGRGKEAARGSNTLRLLTTPPVPSPKSLFPSKYADGRRAGSTPAGVIALENKGEAFR